ncbi:hypothetical protein L1987_40115 [Smallanthus sonchifolius]|uniref:Uncharacterized protein n=1 Tax=Smallanthus sonchifolius TaxID=185202 RepID=A0ACB9GTQ9_9ASTR|nr:hypothetical protein L1987_40115 [Smallanthus sonchifolius]
MKVKPSSPSLWSSSFKEMRGKCVQVSILPKRYHYACFPEQNHKPCRMFDDYDLMLVNHVFFKFDLCFCGILAWLFV